MALNVKKIGGGIKNFIAQANIEAGNYPARLVQLIDLGLQAQKPYKGKDKAPAQEIMLTYELVDEFMKDEAGEDVLDKPRWISETLPFFGLFADKAKSTQRYNAFDPKGEYDGDFAKAAGEAVNVAIVNNAVGDKIYDNVGSVSTMRPRDAQQCPDLVNPAKVFDLDAPDVDVFTSLPAWIQEKIKGNLNYAGSPLEALLAPDKGVDKAPPAKAAVKAPKPIPKAVDEQDDDDRPY